MNTCKIQQDILKLLFSKPESIIYHPLRDRSGTAVGTEYAFFVIPTDEFFLNVGFIKSSSAIIECLDRRYNRDYKLAEFVRYDEVKYHTRTSSGALREKRVKCAIFKNEYGYAVIDKKYVEYLKDSDSNFYIDNSSRYSPVLVYDDYYNPLAAIFPIIVHIEEFEKK